MNNFIVFVTALFALTKICLAENKGMKHVGELLYSIDSHLSQLSNQLVNIKNDVGNKGFVYKSAIEKKNLNLADKFFTDKQYGLAIGFYKSFHAINNRQDPEESAISYIHLGDAYFELKQFEFAYEAYVNGLRQLISLPQKKYQLMINTIRKIYYTTTIRPRSEIKDILANFLSLEISNQYKHELFFWASRLAAKHGFKSLAAQWLANVELHEDDDDIETRSLYFQALIAISTQKIAVAKQLLKRALTQKNADTVIKDLCNIGLARIYFHQNKLDNALSYYMNVSENSQIETDLLSEKIYLYYRLNQFEKAKITANIYLSKVENAEIKAILPYFDLMSADANLASNSLNQAENEAISHIEWLDNFQKTYSRIDYDLLLKIDERGRQIASRSPIIEQAFKTFFAINEQHRLIEAAEQDLNSMLLAISQTDINALRPDWQNKTRQLDILVRDIFRVGNQLAEVDKNTYRNELNQLDLAKIDASEQFRKVLLNKRQWIRFQHSDWKNFTESWEMAIKLKKMQKAIVNINANIAGLYFYNHDQNSSALEPASKALNEAHNSLVEIYRDLQYVRLESLKKIAPLFALKRLASSFSIALLEEKTIYDSYRQTNRNIAQHFIAIDMVRSWNKWEYMMEESFKLIDNLSSEISDRVNSLLKHLYSQKNQIDKLKWQLDKNSQLITEILNQSLSEILSYYLVHARNNLARIRKWSGDSSWLESNMIKLNRDDNTMQFNIDRQNIESKLKLALRGIRWATPN